MKNKFWAFSLIPLALFGELPEEQLTTRIYDHILLRDYLSAVAEGSKAIGLYPHSQPVIKAYFRALCQQGDEMGALQTWKKIAASDRNERSILEALAWGVLNKAKHSTQLEIRLNMLMAAAFTRDVKALPLLLEEMKSSNAMLRSAAIQMAANFGDAPLKKELERLLIEERLWYVRLGVIQAVGQLRMKELQPVLKEMLANPKTSLEERGTIQVALIGMYETIDRAELLALVNSSRASLRYLACEIVAYLERSDLAADLYPLLHDTSSDVRIAAINALTLLKVEGSFERIRPLLDDPAYDVAITSAWSAMVFEPRLGEKKLRLWLTDPDAERRRLAAGALAASGQEGIQTALKAMKESSDSYVKATLAMGLINQRKHVRMAQKILYSLLMNDQKTEWMWDTQHNHIFRRLAPSRLRHRDGIPQYPKVVDQMVRLELLSLLCITRYSDAEEAVRGFLKSHSWGVTGTAASILLGEGDERSIEISEQLLKDPDEKVRLQAAFILAFMGNNEAALPVLLELYPRLDRGMKLHVIDAIAQLGESSSIEFLIEQLEEPFQVLRVAAASAIIRCLYH